MVNIVCFGVLGAFFAFIFRGILWSKWDDYKKKDIISFRQFRSLYEIAPERWEISDYNYYVMYYYYVPEAQDMDCYKWIALEFNPIDKLRYRRWLAHRNAQKRNEQSRETMTMLVKEWQKDIDRYREKYGMN